MSDEQKVVPHKDNETLPEEAVVPPGKSGETVTNTPEQNDEFNQPDKPVKLPSDNINAHM